MEQQQLKNIIEAVLMSADKPLKVNEIEALFAGDADMPTRDEIRKAIRELGEDYQGRGFELKEVASGFRLQVSQGYAQWIGRLWEEKPARYSRALLETIALIAYRQPITRGEIEEVRGVSVSSNIIKTLMEREWIKVLGHKDVPGKPALYGTTKEFLDYFNLKSLEDLPSLAEIKDLDQIHQELDLDMDSAGEAAGQSEQGEQGEDDTQTPGADDAEEASASAQDETQAEHTTKETAESVTTDDQSADTDTVDDETVDEQTVEAESTEDEDEREAAALTRVPVNADNDDSLDDEDGDREHNDVAAEADDSKSSTGVEPSASSATETDAEAADDDASAEEDEFAESEPRAQSVAG
jgi:segregation and condensation protein B